MTDRYSNPSARSHPRLFLSRNKTQPRKSFAWAPWSIQNRPFLFYTFKISKVLTYPPVRAFNVSRTTWVLKKDLISICQRYISKSLSTINNPPEVLFDFKWIMTTSTFLFSIIYIIDFKRWSKASFLTSRCSSPIVSGVNYPKLKKYSNFY